MLHTLRSRLALSHAIPTLILMPLLGLLLLYQIEQSYFQSTILSDLTLQGELIADLTSRQWDFWQRSDAVHLIGARVDLGTSTSLMLLDREGRLLSSTDSAEASLAALTPDLPLLQQTVTDGQVRQMESDALTGPHDLAILVPVMDRGGQVVGVVRMARRTASLQEQLWRLRWMILTTLFAGGLFSLTLGLVLAHALSSSLERLSQAVSHFRLGEEPAWVPEQGSNEIRNLTHAYNVMGQKIQALESSRRKILAGVVHELARPLGGIKAAAQTIEKNDNRELNVEMATGINTAVDQLKLQLEDMALLGQIEQKALTLDKEAVDLAALVESQCRQLQSLAAQKRLHLSCQPLSNAPVIVLGDARRLGQIVGNLVHNGIKYTPGGGTVAVSVGISQAEDKPAALVRITDSGPGIDPAEQEAIFEFYYRNPQQKRIHLGLGIGLALSRWLTDAHGGTLSVDSRPGEGATFILTLPLVSQADSPTTSPLS
ncbi:MAG: ATP-binding protein [Caldilineaceae bacterium]